MNISKYPGGGVRGSGGSQLPSKENLYQNHQNIPDFSDTRIGGGGGVTATPTTARRIHRIYKNITWIPFILYIWFWLAHFV